MGRFSLQGFGKPVEKSKSSEDPHFSTLKGPGAEQQLSDPHCKLVCDAYHHSSDAACDCNFSLCSCDYDPIFFLGAHCRRHEKGWCEAAGGVSAPLSVYPSFDSFPSRVREPFWGGRQYQRNGCSSFHFPPSLCSCCYLYPHPSVHPRCSTQVYVLSHSVLLSMSAAGSCQERISRRHRWLGTLG